ncbi:hypothetical protein GDO81_012059 [Engystomops pustulosus]|uniref:Uncharacterized protein n=1 Tax=Engystomops pustulosus TaxID=76066 RepID=A0AAV7BIP9_ENGPU|nr:hypothetical protein GDO81_012059 [Engystomops pustulosus]
MNRAPAPLIFKTLTRPVDRGSDTEDSMARPSLEKIDTSMGPIIIGKGGLFTYSSTIYAESSTLTHQPSVQYLIGVVVGDLDLRVRVTTCDQTF